jgi:ubiquinone biosynthesis protein COQ4
MTSAAPPVNASARVRQRAKPAGRRDYGRALKALGRLFADKEDTAQVFEIMRALNGGAGQKNYLRLLSTAEGGRLAYEHVELADLLMNRGWLASLPAGSVGAAYAAFTSAEQISAEGLIAESRKGVADGEVERAHPYAWFGRRIRDTHDVWHVLTGYGRDSLGEVCLVAFSYHQTRGLGWALIGLGGYLRTGGRDGAPYRAAIREAWRRGKAAAWLPGEDYERLLAEPLEAARRRLGITPAVAYEAVPGEARNPPPA